MSGGHVGGTRGWKAYRAPCPVCKRDTALSPERTGKLAGQVMRIKRHGSPLCRGIGYPVSASSARYPDAVTK